MKMNNKKQRENDVLKQILGIWALVGAAGVFMLAPWFSFSQSVEPQRIGGVVLSHLIALAFAILFTVYGCREIIEEVALTNYPSTRLTANRLLAGLAGLIGIAMGKLVFGEGDMAVKALRISFTWLPGSMVIILGVLAWLNLLFYLPAHPFQGGVLLIVTGIICASVIDVISLVLFVLFLLAGICAITSTKVIKVT